MLERVRITSAVGGDQMAKAKRGGAGGRGSSEAIEKRRVARQLNALFGPGGSQNGKLDGRTEKRRKRLLKELKEGRRGEPLKPIEIVSHANELLELGETLSSIRKNGVRSVRIDARTQNGVAATFSSEQLEAVQRTQSAYGFRPEVWKLLGVNIDRAPDEGRAARAPARRRRT
jgi:hypothetical protein